MASGLWIGVKDWKDWGQEGLEGKGKDWGQKKGLAKRIGEGLGSKDWGQKMPVLWNFCLFWSVFKLVSWFGHSTTPVLKSNY